MAGIMDKIMAGMTDKKGLFQGGKQNRPFGRVRDVLEGDTNQMPAQKSPEAVGSGGFSDAPSYRPELKAFEEDPSMRTLRALNISKLPGGQEGYDKRLSRFMTEGSTYGDQEYGWGSDPLPFSKASHLALTTFDDPETGRTGGDISSTGFKNEQSFSRAEKAKYSDILTGWQESGSEEYLKAFGDIAVENPETGQVHGRAASPGDTEAEMRYSQAKEAGGTPFEFSHYGRPVEETVDTTIAALEGKPQEKYLGDEEDYVPNVLDIVKGVSEHHGDATMRRGGEGAKRLQKEAYAEHGEMAMEEYGRVSKIDPRIEEAGY